MTDSTDPVAATPAANPVHPATELRTEVDSLISSSGPTVRQRVVQSLVDQEIAKRTDLILRGLSKRNELRKALNKIKPDQISYDGDGKIVSQTYSKAKADELKKANEDITKLDKALSDALSDKPNFDGLNKALGNDGKQAE